LLDADADRTDLELRLIKLLLKDRARVHPFAGNGGSWRKAVIHAQIKYLMVEGLQVPNRQCFSLLVHYSGQS
jgi:hypothetical protein